MAQQHTYSREERPRVPTAIWVDWTRKDPPTQRSAPTDNPQLMGRGADRDHEIFAGLQCRVERNPELQGREAQLGRRRNPELMPFCNGSPLSMQAVGNDMKRSEGSGTGDPGAAEAPTRIIRAGRRKTSLSAEGYPTALSPRGAGVVLEENASRLLRGCRYVPPQRAQAKDAELFGDKKAPAGNSADANALPARCFRLKSTELTSPRDWQATRNADAPLNPRRRVTDAIMYGRTSATQEANASAQHRAPPDPAWAPPNVLRREFGSSPRRQSRLSDHTRSAVSDVVFNRDASQAPQPRLGLEWCKRKSTDVTDRRRRPHGVAQDPLANLPSAIVL